MLKEPLENTKQHHSGQSLVLLAKQERRNLAGSHINVFSALH